MQTNRIAAACLLIAGCATHTAGSSGALLVVAQGNVPTTDRSAFADCVMAGFDRGPGQMTDVNADRRWVTGAQRIETSVGRFPGVIMRAEVSDDGAVRLYQSSGTLPRYSSTERVTFASCLKLYAKS